MAKHKKLPLLKLECNRNTSISAGAHVVHESLFLATGDWDYPLLANTRSAILFA